MSTTSTKSKKTTPVATKKCSTTKSVKAVKCTSVFPTKELESWLKNRSAWNHQDWLGLIEDLRAKGHAHLTDHQEGLKQIGDFLEKNRI